MKTPKELSLLIAANVRKRRKGPEAIHAGSFRQIRRQLRVYQAV